MEDNITLALQQLRDNRLMKDDEQLALFEEALYQLGDDEAVTNIPALCQGFEDNTTHSEVTAGLIPLIEGYDSFCGREEQLRYFIQGIPIMLPHAANWLRTMLVRILNDTNSRILFSQLLATSNPELKELVRTVLQKISADDPAKFEAKVQEVI
jgi:hypothetical protein